MASAVLCINSHLTVLQDDGHKSPSLILELKEVKRERKLVKLPEVFTAVFIKDGHWANFLINQKNGDSEKFMMYLVKY